MQIDLLYFDDCPNWQAGYNNLVQALRDEGIHGTINLIKVTDNVDAARRKFLGSPSYQIAGVDLWPETREQYDLPCRVYATPQGMQGAPTVAMLREKLRALIKNNPS